MLASPEAVSEAILSVIRLHDYAVSITEDGELIRASVEHPSGRPARWAVPSKWEIQWRPPTA